MPSDRPIAGAPPRPKKHYRRPRLALLGSVRELTFGASGSRGDGMMTKRP